ncbi:MAG: cell division protein ZapA [Bacteroidales bacterium]|nr:cell division protein ZapA [Bacteroidales bacterium]
MEDQPVTVNILGRSYKLKISPDDEAYLRQAADNINSQAKEYGRHFGYNDFQDLLTMVALGQITELVKMKASLNYKDDGLLEKLANIDKMLDEYLHPTRNSL